MNKIMKNISRDAVFRDVVEMPTLVVALGQLPARQPHAGTLHNDPRELAIRRLAGRLQKQKS